MISTSFLQKVQNSHTPSVNPAELDRRLFESEPRLLSLVPPKCKWPSASWSKSAQPQPQPHGPVGMGVGVDVGSLATPPAARGETIGSSARKKESKKRQCRASAWSLISLRAGHNV
jgi:hypothetical protein